MSKPVVKLVGEDGNIFSIAGRVSRALKSAGLREQAEEYSAKLMTCGSYDEALQLTMQYVEVR